MDFRSKLQKITSIESLDLEALKDYNSFRNRYIDFLHNRLTKDEAVPYLTEFMQLADFIYSKLDTNSVIPLTKSHFIKHGGSLYSYIYNYNLIIMQKLSSEDLKTNSLFQALKSTIIKSVEPYIKEIFCIYDEHLYKDNYIETCYKPIFIDSDSIKNNNYEKLYHSFENFSLLIETLESIEDVINKNHFDDTMVIPEEIIDDSSVLLVYLVKYYNRCLESSSTNVDGIWLACKTYKMIRSLVKNFFYLYFDSYLSLLHNDAYHIRRMIYDFIPFICSEFDQYNITYSLSYYFDLKNFLYEGLLERLTPLLASCSNDPKLTYAIIDIVKTTNSLFKEDITSFKNFDIFSLTLLVDIYPQDMHIPLIFVFIIQSYINILKQSLSTDSVCIALNKTTLEDISKKVDEIFNLNYIHSLYIESTYLQKTDFFQALIYHIENSVDSRFKVDKYQLENRTYKITNDNSGEVLSQLISDITSIQNDRILFLKHLFDNYNLVDFEFLNGVKYIYKDDSYNVLRVLSDEVKLEDLNISDTINDLLYLYEKKNLYSQHFLFKREDYNSLQPYIFQYSWISPDRLEFDDSDNKFYSLDKFLLNFKTYENTYRDNVDFAIDFLLDFKNLYDFFIENDIDDGSYGNYLMSYSNLYTITPTPNQHWCYCYKHPFTKNRFAVHRISSGYKINNISYNVNIIEIKDKRTYNLIEEELESSLVLISQDNSIEIFNFMSNIDDEGYTKSCDLIRRTIDDYQVLSPIVDTDRNRYVDFYVWWFINNLFKSTHNSSKKLVYRESDNTTKFEDFFIDNFYIIDRVNDTFSPILRYDSSSIKSLEKLPIDGHMIWKCNSRIVDFIEILKSKSIDFTLPHRKSSWYSLSNIQPPSYNKIEDLTPYCCFIRWVNDTNSYYFFKEDNLDIKGDLLMDESNSNKIISRFAAYNDFDFFESILYDHKKSSYNGIEVDYDEDLEVIRFPRKSETTMGYYLDLKEEDDRFIVLDAIDCNLRSDIYDYSDYYKIYSESSFKLIESSLSEGKNIIIIKPFSFTDGDFDLSRVVIGETNRSEYDRLKLKYISLLNREFDKKVLTKENIHKISTYNLLDGWLKSKDVHITDKNQDEVVLDILNNEEFTVDMISKLQIFLQTKTSLEILIHWLNFLIECKDRIENASSEEEMKIIYSHFKIELETKPKG